MRMILEKFKRAASRHRTIKASSPIPDDSPPIAVQFTPNSILADPEPYTARYFNGRPRFATCSGVTWFHRDYLATANVLGRSIHVYHFEEGTESLRLAQTLHKSTSLNGPENLFASPNGRLLAVTDVRSGDVNIFTIDAESHRLSEEPCHTISRPEDGLTHGVSFSPCSRFLAYTTVDEASFVRVFHIEQAGDKILVEDFQQIRNRLRHMVPKGIDFSPDGSRVVICYGPNASATARQRTGGSVHLHSFNEKTGISKRACSIGSPRLRLLGPDDVKFFRSGKHIILTEQGTDRGVIVAVDVEAGTIGEQVTVLGNPNSHMDFPHGVGFSCDGKYFAVTSYGDDKFAVFRASEAA